MITLTNPLTTKERLSVVRLLGHDSQNQIAMISSNLRAYEIIAKNPRRDNTRILPYDVLKALAIHVSHTQQTVRDLVQFKKFICTKQIYLV